MKAREVRSGVVITARGRLQDRDEPFVVEHEIARVIQNVTGAEYLAPEHIAPDIDVLYVQTSIGSHRHWYFRSEDEVEVLQVRCGEVA